MDKYRVTIATVNVLIMHLCSKNVSSQVYWPLHILDVFIWFQNLNNHAHVSRITCYPRAITQTTLSVRGASGSLVKTHSCSHAYMKFRQHSKQLSFSDMFLYHFVLFDIVCLYFMVFIIYYVIIIQMLLSQ